MSFIKSEFKLKNFKLNHPDPDLHLTSRWQQSYVITIWYMVYRMLLALYHTGWLIYLFIDEGGVQADFSRKLYFFIYMTNWSYLVLTVMNVVWAVIVTLAYVKFSKEGLITKRMGLSLKLLWTLENITFMPAFIVTLIYWAALYDPGNPISATNAEAHIMNSIYTIIELMVSATPIRLLHFHQPIIYLLVYVLFSLIYYVAGGTTPDGSHYIYSVLDWEQVGDTVIFLAVGAVVALLLQVLVWLLHLIREKLHSCLKIRGTEGHFELA